MVFAVVPRPAEPDRVFAWRSRGVGYALLELYRATGDHRFRDGAEGAFAYERRLYNPDAVNWPDLRQSAPDGDQPEDPPSYAALWCHGAPGIALSRLRASELLGDSQYRNEALTALQTTRDSVRSGLLSGNYSLCHGLAGNAEVLAEGRPLLDGESENLVHTIARTGIETYGQPERCWPGGVPGGCTASLFLGLAGTAHFYLRLSDAAVPSVLLMRPEHFPR